MQILGSNELLEQVQKKDLCVVCGACVDLCPYFKFHMGKVSMIFPCDLEQGKCYANCPRTEIDYDRLSQHIYGKPYNDTALGEYRKIMASKAGEKLGGGSFQNGGTVSALITCALKNGFIDAAVLTKSDGLLPVPALVTEAHQVIGFASSKYMGSPTVASVNVGAKEGYEKMGVVGTSCQITAVAQMKSNLLENNDFKDPVALSVGLFCTWSLDTRKFIEFLSGRVDISSIQGMEVPPPPAEIIEIRTDNGTIEIPLSEIRPFIPDGCSLCSDMTNEWADVSVGSFEGKPGWNTLIVRTDKGEKIVDTAVKEGYLVLDELPAESITHLTEAAANKKKKALEGVRLTTQGAGKEGK